MIAFSFRMRGNKGFTLVEMVVALSIFSLLMTLLMTGFSQGLSLWERGKAKASRWQFIEYRHGLLAQIFQEARIADYRGERGATYPHFFAQGRWLEFITRSPILDLSGRTRPVKLFFEYSEETGLNTITYQEAGRHNDLDRGIFWSQARKALLLDNISELRLRYLAPEFPLPQELALARLTPEEELRYRDNSEWLDWYDSSILWSVPLAVEISFVDEFGVKQAWLFKLPKETDAWSMQGQLDGYQ